MSVLSIFKNVKVDLKFLIPTLFLIVILAENVKSVKDSYDESDVKVEKLSHCDEKIIHDRGISQRNIFVTTLDGRLSTLDITRGDLRWSTTTEPGELLSSSIHRLELTSSGKQVRMIPSLSGGIYKFDGESIEAIPITAEELLKSSFKFSDDLVISGGTEVRTYGINSRNGNVVYEYSMAGGRKSQNLSERLDDEPSNDNSVLDDVLVLKRHTQTVRAIEPRTGDMRWNFSIGHHELELISSDNCQPTKLGEQEEILQDLDLRVIVPEGLVCAYNKKNPNTILWKHKFESPVVSIYRMDLKSRRLESVDLFKNVNWLWQGTSFKPAVEFKLSPSVYLGMYQQQLYIQESTMMRKAIDHHNQLEHNLVSDEIDLPKIPFKPLPASNKEIVALIEGKTHDESSSHEPKELIQKNELNAKSVLYASPYADGKGFYFYTEKQINHSMQCKKTRSTHVNPEDYDNMTFNSGKDFLKSSTLFDYWKEIIVIALTTALFVNFLLNNHRKRQENGIVYVTVPYAKEAINYEEEEKQKKEIEELKREVLFKTRSISESNGFDPYQHYNSRFLSDFDLVQCLGKGGFGVVFEVKNKLDDCNYAIKRILLPSRKESRDRVLREVKTLANCEHQNIVRYFHSWIEEPPNGWQEARDKELLSRDILSTSITIDSPSPTEESKAFLPPFVSQSNEPWQYNNFNDNDSFDLSLKENKNYLNTEDSSSFIQFKHDTNDVEDEQTEKDDSIEIEFKNITQTSISGMPSDSSHLISFRENDDESLSNHKSGHKRTVSIDLSDISSSIKPKRPTALSTSSSSSRKFYLYIQMQLCMKHSLKDWLMANELHQREDKTLKIWSQIIDAVHYVHLKGLIHRDLKPSNIFFALDGRIKIGDFGLVTDMAEIPVDPLTSSTTTSNSNSSSSGNMEFDFTKISEKKHTQRVGTSLYMSPEQSKGLPYNYKVDIFSLGLIYFELLNFFGTESERFRVLEKIRKHQFPPQFIENHKDEHELLKIMLSKKPEERPTTYGVLSRPPLNKFDNDYVNWHFELPTRRKESHGSQNGLSK